MKPNEPVQIANVALLGCFQVAFRLRRRYRREALYTYGVIRTVCVTTMWKRGKARDVYEHAE